MRVGEGGEGIALSWTRWVGVGSGRVHLDGRLGASDDGVDELLGGDGAGEVAALGGDLGIDDWGEGADEVLLPSHV